jgi:5'-methylthioadenosine phosphorylase
MEGPQFSTLAESKLYRSWGMDIIGMTNLQEAKLAREAEICYTTIALVTDYDCWHESEESVTVAAVMAVLRANSELAQRIVAEVAGSLPDPSKSPAARALEHAVITAHESIEPAARNRLGFLLDRGSEKIA